MVHHDLHSEGFFTWLVGEDDHNSSLHVIQVDQVKCFLLLPVSALLAVSAKLSASVSS